jgi:hypothetical protein
MILIPELLADLTEEVALEVERLRADREGLLSACRAAVGRLYQLGGLEKAPETIRVLEAAITQAEAGRV